MKVKKSRFIKEQEARKLLWKLGRIKTLLSKITLLSDTLFYKNNLTKINLILVMMILIIVI